MPPIDPDLWRVFLGTGLALAIGSVVRWFTVRGADPQRRRQRLGSLAVWWVLLVLVAVAASGGRWGLTLLLALVSGMCLGELVRLHQGLATVGVWTTGVLLALSGLHFLAVAVADFESFPCFYPWMLLLGLAVIRLAPGQCGGGPPVTAGIYWGAMLLVFGLSHAVALVDASRETQPWAGPVGWFLFVMLLTELNDILQALIGRRWGRRPITPVLSPHKTVEGWLGGLLGTIGLAVLLGPWLTTWPSGLGAAQRTAALLGGGILIALSGLIGDLNFSALKRHAGIKDSGQVLPGMGGMIDRLDSLTLSAPVFYYYVRLVEASSA